MKVRITEGGEDLTDEQREEVIEHAKKRFGRRCRRVDEMWVFPKGCGINSGVTSHHIGKRPQSDDGVLVEKVGQLTPAEAVEVFNNAANTDIRQKDTDTLSKVYKVRGLLDKVDREGECPSFEDLSAYFAAQDPTTFSDLDTYDWFRATHGNHGLLVKLDDERAVQAGEAPSKSTVVVFDASTEVDRTLSGEQVKWAFDEWNRAEGVYNDIGFAYEYAGWEKTSCWTGIIHESGLRIPTCCCIKNYKERRQFVEALIKTGVFPPTEQIIEDFEEER